jgi:hypothetical protein
VRTAPKRTLLLLHVQKTGGTAVSGALANRFAAPDCLNLYFGPEPDLGDIGRYRFVTGHITARLVQRFTEPPFVVTVLRDPIDRALSAYSYSRSFPLEYEGPKAQLGRGPEAYQLSREWRRLTAECSLGELISRAPEVAREYLGNRQARALCGSRAGDERLPDAIGALERCDFVGLSDRLDASVDWLARRLGWKGLGPLPRVNVTGNRVRREQVPSETMEGLVRLTEVDRELHRRGVERFERQLAEWSASRNPRDPSARILDADPVDDLRFHQAILGGGWMRREPNEDGTAFCWIGDTRRAWVDMVAGRQADTLLVEITHALDEEVLRSLCLSVDGRVVPHTLAEEGGTLVATAPLPRRLLLRRRRRVSIEVERSAHPREVNPESLDHRELAISVRRIALRRS